MQICDRMCSIIPFLTGSFAAVLMSFTHGWFDSISAHAVSLQADRADWKGFVYRSFYI